MQASKCFRTNLSCTLGSRRGHWVAVLTSLVFEALVPSNGCNTCLGEGLGSVTGLKQKFIDLHLQSSL